MESTKQFGTVAQSMQTKLSEQFKPVHLDVIDESHNHASHEPMQDYVRKVETHFKVVIVSDQFEGKKIIDRHRAINECLTQELEEGVHALSIDAKTPKQWETKLKQSQQESAQ